MTTTVQMVQVIEQTDEEKMAMYMAMPKEKIAAMLIECNKIIKSYSSKPVLMPTPPNPLIQKVVFYLNAITRSSYKHTSKSTQRYISARIKEGYEYGDFALVIESRNYEWGNDDQMKQYLRPETLFGTKFESYLQFAKSKQINKSTGMVM